MHTTCCTQERISRLVGKKLARIQQCSIKVLRVVMPWKGATEKFTDSLSPLQQNFLTVLLIGLGGVRLLLGRNNTKLCLPVREILSGPTWSLRSVHSREPSLPLSDYKGTGQKCFLLKESFEALGNMQTPSHQHPKMILNLSVVRLCEKLKKLAPLWAVNHRSAKEPPGYLEVPHAQHNLHGAGSAFAKALLSFQWLTAWIMTESYIYHHISDCSLNPTVSHQQKNDIMPISHATSYHRYFTCTKRHLKLRE